METEQNKLTFKQIFIRIKMGIAIALIAGGSYLAYETFTVVKSVLAEPTSLKKWVDLRPSIMTEPIEQQTPAKPKLPPKTGDPEVDALTLWVLVGYFSILLGFLYAYLLVKISLALVTSGLQLLTNTIKEK